MEILSVLMMEKEGEGWDKDLAVLGLCLPGYGPWP